MMKQQYQPLFLLTLILIFLSHCTKTLAQGPAAAPAITSPAAIPAPPANAPALTSPAAIPAPPANAPAPPGPTNATKILGKAGGFNVLIRLLKTTQVDNQLYGQLNKSNTEFTLLAPSDSAFSNLKGGSLNSLSVEQKVKLLQFHLIPDFLTTQNFQTVSNPVRTQVGDGFEYPLNITISGNAVNISTGLVNTSISDTVYSDDGGELESGQTTIVFTPLRQHETDILTGAVHTPTSGRERQPVEVCFAYRAVDAAYKRAVENGSVPVSEPEEREWGQKVGYVRDLDGIQVRLGSYVNPPKKQ